MKTLNPEKFAAAAAIFSDRAIISPCNDGYALYYLGKDALRNKLCWLPICEATREIIPETIRNKYGRIERHKSSFKIGGWYINAGEYNFNYEFIEKKLNTKVERLG